MTTTALPRSATLSRIPSLDGLRALSIFLVISLHTLQRFSITHHVNIVWYAVFNGGYGVFIFFEISGFLITSLLLQEHHKRGSVSLPGFYLRRAFRILPPLYLYIGFVVLLGVMGKVAMNRLDILSGVFFFHNFPSGLHMWPLEHLWSISVEEQFYVWWPFLLVFCLRIPGVRGLYAASVVPVVILMVGPFLRVLTSLHRNNPVMHDIGKLLNLDFLMFGCLVALLQHTPRFEAVYRRVTRIWWLPMVGLLVCSCISARFENYFNLTIGFTIIGFIMAMLLLWSTRNPETAVGRILNWGPIAKIGVLSYSIYLWQTLFLHEGNEPVFGAIGWLGRFPFNWLGILLAGAFSYYVVERPFLKLRSRLISTFHVYVARRKPAKLSVDA